MSSTSKSSWMRLPNGLEVSRIDYLSAVAKWRTRNATEPWSYQVRVKGLDDALTEAGSTSSAGPQYGGVVPPDYPGWVAPPSRPLLIASVIGAATTSSNLVRVVRAVEAGAGGVEGEGEAFDEVVMQAAVDDTAKVVDSTAMAFVSENLLVDSPSTGPYLTARMSYLAARAEENALVNGSGAMTGLLDATDEAVTETATTHTQTTEPLAAAVANICMRVYDASFLIPTFVAMSPATYFEHLVARSGAGTGDFLAGPPGVLSMRQAWGMQLVVTGALGNSTVLVGSREAATRHVRDLSVALSPNYGTAFGRGLVAVRGRLRSALSFERPSGIGVLTLANASALLGS